MGAKIKVGVVQSEPVWYNLQGSVARVNELIQEAHNKGVELLAFSEVHVPGYPVWIWNNASAFDKNVEYIKNSLSYDSEEFQSIIETIKAYPVHVVLGFSERDGSSIYISQCIINKQGEIVLKRRKFKPTHVERILWGDATSQDLKSVVQLNFKEAGLVEVGCLSCWEHIQPLLYYNSAAQGEKIHVGSWPVISNNDESIWCFTKKAFHTLARAYSMQTGSFYLFSSNLGQEVKEKLSDVEILPTFETGEAGTAIFRPDGSVLEQGPGDDFDGVVVAELDMDDILKQKHLVDIVGHYSRPDMISLRVFDSNSDFVESG